MKIRNGFVSNSSSSSFVIIGVPRKGDFEDEKLEKGLRTVSVEEDDYDVITGVVLSDDEYLDDTITTFSELQEMAQKVANFLKVDISEVKLITGTRPC